MSAIPVKQTSKQDAFKQATEYAISIWKTSVKSINQVTKEAAKQYKVDTDELAGYVFKRVKNNESK